MSERGAFGRERVCLGVNSLPPIELTARTCKLCLMSSVPNSTPTQSARVCLCCSKVGARIAPQYHCHWPLVHLSLPGPMVDCVNDRFTVSTQVPLQGSPLRFGVPLRSRQSKKGPSLLQPHSTALFTLRQTLAIANAHFLPFFAFILNAQHC